VTVEEIITRYQRSAEIAAIHASLNNELPTRLYISGLKASQPSFVAAAILKLLNKTHIFVLPEKESAAYFHNDLETIFEEKEKNMLKGKFCFCLHLTNDLLNWMNLIALTYYYAVKR
jgi:hypothetical protein